MTPLSSVAEFQTALQQFNELLQPLDKVTALERQKKDTEASAAIAEIGEGVLSQLRQVADERSALIRENYKLHSLVSADDPESETYKHLAAHLHGDVFGSVFSNSKTLSDPHQIISFAEHYLQKAYTGGIPSGQGIKVMINNSRCIVTFLPANAIADGISVGPSSEGGRVVLKVEFEEIIGRDAVTAIEGKSSTLESRTLGGRDEQVSIVEGNAPQTKTMYIMGGAYGPTGKFGLYTTFPGTYAPPMSDKEYWSKHGFYRS
jgi:hypothetical protein